MLLFPCCGDLLGLKTGHNCLCKSRREPPSRWMIPGAGAACHMEGCFGSSFLNTCPNGTRKHPSLASWPYKVLMASLGDTSPCRHADATCYPHPHMDNLLSTQKVCDLKLVVKLQRLPTISERAVLEACSNSLPVLPFGTSNLVSLGWCPRPVLCCF